ncbi:cytochrome P450 [Mycobacterium sp. pW049]|uniref:cytochrome P450 n=1 Tax=[Mycobacterium] bulgaricum TaxID=3238985 RepID=UPI00351B9B36
MTADPETQAAPFIGARNGGRDLDHHAPEYREHWPEIFDQIRKSKCPVAHSSHYGGFFIVNRYEDVAEIARDDDTYSSENDLGQGPRQGITIPGTPIHSGPIETDPPRLGELRKVMMKPLSPSAAKTWEPWLRDLTNHFIDSFIEAGEGDLVLGIGNPVPAIFTMQFLGLPLDDWEMYAMPMHQVVYASPGSKELEQAYIGIFGFLERLKVALEDRRAHPTDDFMSKIVTARIDGEPLSEQDALEMAFLVVAGGVDTTTGLLASSLDWLELHPEERTRLAASPELIPKATEEFLRYVTPVQGNGRTVTRECEFRGQKFSDGDRVLLSWAAANRDPDVFDDPHTVNFERHPNRHQAFGIGMHRCAGSNIARVIFGVMLSEVLRRIPDYVIDRDRAEPYGDIATVNGWKSQPVTFTPGPVEDAPFDKEFRP